MQSLIDSSSAFFGAGSAAARRQFKLRAGPYNGRKLVVYQSDAATIKCCYADAPYKNWLEPQNIANNSADYPCSGCIDSDGNVYVVYTVQGTLNLAFRKLTFNSGNWTIGAEVIVYNDKANYSATIARDSTGRLHICWTCFDSATGVYTIRHKRSTSDGDSWGSGPGDPGTALGESSSAAYSVTAYAAPYLYCHYNLNGTQLIARRMIDGASIWEDAVAIHTGVYLNDRLCSCVSESQSLVGVAFEANYKLWYAECDGANWGGVFDIASLSATAPLLQFNGEVPYVTYGVEVGAGQVELRYRCKTGVGFAPEAILAPEISRFAAVYLYDHDGDPQFHNRTLEAASTVAADVLATDSHALVEAVDDALYLGAEAPYGNVNLQLSTAGAGGSVAWEYYSDFGWKSFLPESGACHLEQATQLLRLWPDSAHAPVDWQKCKIESRSYFWIRARVTTAFTTAPVGSQITPCGEIAYINN